MFLLQNLKLDYEPYPIGLIAPVLDKSFYRELLDTFPPLEIFRHVPVYGSKYSLSEKNHPRRYQDFIRTHPAWRELHRYIKSKDFVFSVIDALRERNIDLRISRASLSFGGRWTKALKNAVRGRLPVSDAPIYSRFEFSILPARGGSVLPHTDAPRKYIILVLSMVGEGEWKKKYGGGTEVLKPKDTSMSYNYFNETIPYEEVETLAAHEFKPNQAVIFVKTYNSLHGVREIQGPEDMLRRTLTINIERSY